MITRYIELTKNKEDITLELTYREEETGEIISSSYAKLSYAVAESLCEAIQKVSSKECGYSFAISCSKRY